MRRRPAGAGAGGGRSHYSDLLPLGDSDIGIYALFQEQPSPDVWVGSGYVDIRFMDTRLQADKITLYLLTNDVVAEGNVVFGLPGQQMTGKRAEINLETGLGTIWESTGVFAPGIYVTARELEYYQTNWIRTSEATFTSCDQPVPDWSFKVKKSRLHLEKYAFLTFPRLKVKNFTLLPLPYLVWPIKTERSTGLLFPSIGMSSYRGFQTGLTFYWVISDSADAEIEYDHYTKWGHGAGAAVRYYVGPYGSGFFDGYILWDKLAYEEDDDPTTEGVKTRWKVDYQHIQDLLYDWRIGANVDMNSDFDFNREYSSNFADFSRRTTSAEAYASRNWSYYSINAVAQNSEVTYLTGGFGSRTTRELPSIEFDGRKQQLWGSPFYFEFDTSYGNLYVEDNRNEREFNRLDLSPTVSMPIKKIPWLKINPEVGYRYTFYDHRVPVDEKGQPLPTEDLVPENLIRKYLFSTVEFVGPSFSKIFNTPRNFYSQKFKHLIEPQISWNYIEPVEVADEVPYFDYGDTVLAVNEVRYALVNRFFAKRKANRESQAQPVSHEFLTLEISQKYSLDEDLATSYGRRFDPRSGGYQTAAGLVDRASPWRAKIKIAPTREFSFDYELQYKAETEEVVERRAGLRMRKQGRYFVAVSYSDDPIFVRETIMGAVGVELFHNRVVADFATQYDLTKSYFPREQIRFAYYGQCYSFQLEYLNYSYDPGEFVGSGYSDRRLEASITLTHIGDLFRYRDRTDQNR